MSRTLKPNLRHHFFACALLLGLSACGGGGDDGGGAILGRTAANIETSAPAAQDNATP